QRPSPAREGAFAVPAMAVATAPTSTAPSAVPINTMIAPTGHRPWSSPGAEVMIHAVVNATGIAASGPNGRHARAPTTAPASRVSPHPTTCQVSYGPCASPAASYQYSSSQPSQPNHAAAATAASTAAH